MGPKRNKNNKKDGHKEENADTENAEQTN